MVATVPLPARPSLEQLRKRARELQRDRRSDDPGFALHHAQRELARHHGFASWPRLVAHVRTIESLTFSAAPATATASDDPATQLLRATCVTYHGAEPDLDAAALIARENAASTSSLAAAAVAGDVGAVQDALAAGANPDAPEAPYDWPPLMYLTYSRLDVGADACLAVASALIDAGADVQAGRYFDGYPTPFTVITGVFGDGERGEPEHPHALRLGRLLLERGADPNDAQTLYNRMFDPSDDVLALLFEFGLGAGDGGVWRSRLPDLAASPSEMLRGLLGWAVLHDQRERVRLLASTGTDLRSALPVTSWLPQPRTPIELAAANGHRELVRLLGELGCPPPQLSEVQRWIGDALAGDVDTGNPMAAEACAARPGLIVWAAAIGHGTAVEGLVGAGFDVNALGRADCPREQPWQTALHTAVAADDADLARRLLALGADPSIEDARFRSDAAGWARFFGHEGLLPLLASG